MFDVQVKRIHEYKRQLLTLREFTVAQARITVENAAAEIDRVLYSGTVAAALEGRFLTLPSFAFSLVSRQVLILVIQTTAQGGGRQAKQPNDEGLKCGGSHERASD